MRCIALAEALRDAGGNVTFVARIEPRATARHVQDRGFELVQLPGVDHAESGDDEVSLTIEAVASRSAKIDWLVVDSYAITSSEESRLRQVASRIAVIDDLANRSHDCDLLVDQNLSMDQDGRYDGLLPASSLRLLGPRFALLRPEFAAAGDPQPIPDGSIRHVLVSFGGTDPTNETAKCLRALSRLRQRDFDTTVVLAESAPQFDEVKNLSRSVGRVRLLSRLENMAELMNDAYLMIGSGGVTTWERCALGLPSVTIVVADNQASSTAAVARAGATVDLGWHEAVGEDDIANAVGELLDAPETVRAMSIAARSIVGGRADGARTVSDMMAMLVTPRKVCRLRALQASDLPQVRGWRNSDRVRLAMTNQHLISLDEHRAWFERVSASEHERHYVFECGSTPLGMVSFKDIESGRGADWGLYIGEAWAPRHSGAKLGVLALGTAFDELGLKTVRAAVLARNEASLGYHERMGFREVARHEVDPDIGHEHVHLSLTAEDWAAGRQELEAWAFGPEVESDDRGSNR